MTVLFDKFVRQLQATPLDFSRGLLDVIRWEARLIGIKGARGVGKTTLLLQYIKKHLKADETTLYVSLDNLWFAENTLSNLVDEFVKQGGKHLFLDEVHKYQNWSQELKNLYDSYPELKIVFTGSSLLEILNARADLSRRAVVYTLNGLSYREYLELYENQKMPVFSLSDILKHHLDIAKVINQKIRPLQYFSAYLQKGYYPFYKEVPELYFHRLEEVINMVLEIELPYLRKVEVAYVHKLKQLLQIVSESVPFTPNVSKLSERIGINRNTLVSYLHFLAEARLTLNLYRDAKGISRLQKPNKIFLENTNLLYALASGNVNTGNLRETFFINQVGHNHKIEYTETGDFKVDDRSVFEVGGKEKTSKQIKKISQAYIAADQIEYGLNNKIPLWLFGFLY